MRRTRIVATIGPASRDVATLRKLVQAGMDVARLNFSHGTHEQHAAVIRAIREGESEWGHPVTIVQDLQGPKVRLGNFVGGRAMLMTGEPFMLTADPVQGTSAGASLDHPDLFAALRPGDQIWMDDGTIQLAVEQVQAREARCRVTAGGVVSDHKGVALPGLPLPLSCLTAKDKADLRFGIEQGVDYVAVSFVRSASDIQEVRKFVLDQRASLPIIAKLERAEIVANLPGILALVDAVMVARGDLGVEVPIEEVPIIQRDVIRQARLAKVPVIVATQMLESMVTYLRPTRDITSTASTGCWPEAVSAESMRASAPSKMAVATSLTSARVGRR